MSARTKAYLYLLVAVAIWGFAGPIIKFTLGTFDPLVFLTYRFFLTSFVLIPFLLIAEPRTLKNISHLSSQDWVALIISGLLGTAGQLLLLFYGFSLTSSIDGTLLSSTSPILVAIAGALFLHERVTKRERLGLFIAFIGTTVIVSQTFFESGVLFSGTLIGNLLVMAGNLCWVVNVIVGKKLLKNRISPLFQTTLSFFLGFLAVATILFSTQPVYSVLQQLSSNNLSAHIGVIYMAILSGGLAYFLYRSAQKYIEASEADVWVYLQPLFGTPLAYFWLKEPITLTFLVGAAIIATGVLIAEFKTRR